MIKRCLNTLVMSSALFAVTASAQTWPELGAPPALEKLGSKDVAVIVAIEDYAFLPDVPGAGRNAADWERFLADGLGVEQVLMLTNQQAVREEILAFAQKAADAAQAGGTLWFLYIGHGGPNNAGDDGLLIGADGQQNTKSMAARGLAQRELLATLETGSQSRTVVLIDACFSGRDSSGGALAKGTMPVLPVNAAPEIAATTVVMTAAKADEFAGDLPGADRPAFSYLVLGGMRGWADDGDGEVTVDEAVSMARRDLLAIPGRQQTPQIIGGKSLVLVRGATEARPSGRAEPPDAGEAPPVGVRTTTVAPDPSTMDGKPDSMLYGNAHVGPMISGGNAIGFGATGALGVKLGEFRVGGLLGIGNPADPGVPSSGTLPTERGNTAPIDGTTGNGTNQFGAIVGATVGYGIRRETPSRDDVFWVDATAGVLAGKVCDGYTYDTGRSKIVCSGTTGSTAPIFGGRLGGKFGIVSATALVGYRSTAAAGDLVMLFAAGVAFDD